MADDDRPTKTPKTKKVGHFDPENVYKIKGWDAYAKKAAAFSKAKIEAEEAKSAVRDTLKEGLVKGRKVRTEDEIDFTLNKDGSITINQILEGTRGRTKSEDLSTLF